MRKLLIANRGEIAVRIARTARTMGIATIAIYSEADADAEHVRVADEAVLVGPPAATKSYLDVAKVIEAATSTGADAIHPGYGFLSENATFAASVIDHGISWVGPSPHSIREMGDKVAARARAVAAGVPVAPGSDGAVADADEAAAIGRELGFPLAIKAAAGGGGRGIRIVECAEELAGAISTAQAESSAAFGSAVVYLERFVTRARHIEVQVFGDGDRAVHLGLRDCSMQRRRQKLVEEAGELGIPQSVAAEMTTSAVALAEAVDYRGAGTVEYLYDPERESCFFLEMNTRIQVEHPVTEMVYGCDLVAEQLRVAAGEPMSLAQDRLVARGHSIEVRLNAENAAKNFLPSPGTIEHLTLPAGPFVRVDSGVANGSVVSPYYDSMLGKVIVWGEDRPRAIARLRNALGEVEVTGIDTTAGFVLDIVSTEAFTRRDHHTTWLEHWMASKDAATQGGN